MITFAFSTDDRGLEVFPSREDAIAYCEGVDVENGLWVFWDQNGEGLSVEFTSPNQKSCYSVVSGAYVFKPFPAAISLLEFSSSIGYVEGRGIFNTLDDVINYLQELPSEYI